MDSFVKKISVAVIPALAGGQALGLAALCVEPEGYELSADGEKSLSVGTLLTGGRLQRLTVVWIVAPEHMRVLNRILLIRAAQSVE